MIGRLRKVSYAGVLLALSFVVLAGCETATGGGFIPSATGEGKATFGFSTKCDNVTLENGDVFGEVKGQLQYIDREADVKFHASRDKSLEQVPSDVTDPCGFLDEAAGQVFGGEVSFVLPYWVQGGPKESEGLAILHVVDSGEPGINGDEFTIRLDGGRYNGYTNSGTIEGGNIQVH